MKKKEIQRMMAFLVDGLREIAEKDVVCTGPNNCPHCEDGTEHKPSWAAMRAIRALKEAGFEIPKKMSKI